MIDQCDGDGFYSYRERIALSDGTVRCCETDVNIPAGMPYAQCQGTYTEEGSQVWEDWPQALEVWRWVRNLSFHGGHCINFGGVEKALEWEYDPGRHTFLYLQWGALIERMRHRYAEGKGPRLYPAERASLESGEWVAALPYTLRKKRE